MSQKDFASIMKKIKNNIIKTRIKYKNATNKIIDDSWALFYNGCEAIFAKHERLNTFGWKQFTPINCEPGQNVFAAYVDEPQINGFDLYTVYEIDEFLAIAADDIIDFLTLFHEDILKKMFGDNMTVLISREGVSLQDYEDIEIEFNEEDQEEDEDDAEETL
jgi:hypothetical protein